MVGLGKIAAVWKMITENESDWWAWRVLELEMNKKNVVTD